jgi:CRISPR/Cas system CSM-associated protein Csm2 small subunit
MNNAKENAGLIAKGVLKSVLGSFPVGATAVEVYNELQSKRVQRKIERLEEFYQSLDDRISTVEEQVNKDYVSKEDFQDVFEEATRYVVLERQSKKRELFKNILANSITAKECDYDKTERYFRLLDNLSELELNILAVLENPEEYNKKHGMIVKDPYDNYFQHTWGEYRADSVLTQLLKIKINDVQGAVTVLFSNGLIVENLLSRRMESNMNPVRVLDNLLTPRGRDFIRFLKGVE